VFTRSTPDTATKVDVGADGKPTWDSSVATVVNPWDEYALEEAIVQAKNHSGKATVVAVGAEMHNESLKHSLAMGLDEAVRVEDPSLNGSDSLAYATAAAATVKKLDNVNLVIFGRESIDVGTDQHAYQTARKLGWTMLSFVSKIIALDPAAGTIKVEKMLENGKQVVTAKLPAVLTVMKEINEPRYPSFMGIRKANKAVIPVWSLADLGVNAPAASVGAVNFKPMPVREVQTVFIEGEPEEMAAKLVEKLIEEKVL
jgi:electron transfer flavoprotein beta subunit